MSNSQTNLRFYTSESLGTTQSLTPDGFLLCENVPVARCGTLLYAAGEIPVKANSDGIIRIQRDPADVFLPSAILSFAGKPVCNEHPPEKVDPSNWKEYSVGVVLNPRRGDGRVFDNNFLYADLLIQDQQSISDVRSGKREVSAGYDADYEQIAPGEGRQHRIVGNHVALVDRGRCGARCSIGDKAMVKTPAWRDRVMHAFRTGDESALVDEIDKVPEMMGKVLMGDEVMPMQQAAPAAPATTTVDPSGNTHHHIVVNVGGMQDDAAQAVPGQAAPVAAPAAVAAPAGNPAAAATTSAPAGQAAGGADVTQMLQQVMQRIEALEQAVTVLANGEEGEGDPSQMGGEEGGAEQNDPDSGTGPTGETGGNGTPPDEVEQKKSDDNTMDAELTTNTNNLLDEGSHSENVPQKLGVKDNKTLDKRAAVGDSSSFHMQWTETLSRAEVLSPGMSFPTFDSKKPAKITYDSLCKMRRDTLGQAMKRQTSKDAIRAVVGTGNKADFATMTCDAVAMVFNGASEIVRKQQGTGTVNADTVYARQNNNMVSSIAEINKRNRERYGLGK